MPDGNVIDNLQIEIESTSKTAVASLSQFQNALKKLDALGNGTGIKNLYKSLKKLETINLSKLSRQLSTIFDAAKKPLEIKTKVTPLNAPDVRMKQTTANPIDTTEILRTSDEVRESTEKIGTAAAVAARNFDHLSDPINRIKAEIDNYSERIKILTNNYNALNASGKGDPLSLLSLEKQIISASGTLDSLKNKFDELSQPPTPEIVKFGRELLNLERPSKKAVSNLSKVVASFRRIIFYRTVRIIIRDIARAFREGMQNYVQYSEQADRTMSNLMNTGRQLKNTLGVTFANVLRALEPLITMLADGVMTIANGINALMAAMRGEDTFARATKGADSYADSLRKVNNQLFSFDRFESISAANRQADMFEMGDVSAELSGMNVDVENLQKAFEGLKGVIASIGGLIASVMPAVISIAAAVLPALAGITRAFTPAITGIARFIGWVITGLDSIGALIPILSALAITLLTLKFLQVRNDAMQFNIAIDEQKLKAHLAKMELNSLKKATDGKATADVRAAQMAYQHEKAMLRKMQTARVLHSAMAALQAVMGATALGATIGDLIKNWGEMTTAQRINQISTIALTAAMTALAIANVAAQSGLGAKIAVPIAVAVIGAGIASAVASARRSVPRLAEGAVIPPNREFLAVLGDQRSGVNIETPLDTMKQAFKDSIMEMGGSVSGGVGDNPSFNLTVVYQDENGRERARRDIPNLVAEVNRAGGLRKVGFNA